MKIWKLHVYWERENESVRRYDKRLSKLDDESLNKYISGGYHFVRKSKGRKSKAPPLTADELKNLLKETAESIDGPIQLQNTDPPKVGKEEK